jgi:hypothetical protein
MVDACAPAFEPDPRKLAEETIPLARKAIALGTREIDQRVMVQQGAFTIHSDAQDLADVDFNYPTVGARPSPWRRAYVVPAAVKSGLRELLRKLGIHESALFPDLGALAHKLKYRPYGSWGV